MAGYHCLMPKGIILRCVPMPNLLAFFFVAFSFPIYPISFHSIAWAPHRDYTKNVRGRESTGHSLLFISVTARLFWQGDGN